MSDYTQALALGRRGPDVYARRAAAYAELGRRDEAATDLGQVRDTVDLEKALFRAKEDWRWAAILCNLDRLAGIYQAPLFDLHHLRGRTNVSLGRYDTALADFANAARLDPNAYRAPQGRAEAYAALGRWKDAESEYTKAIDLYKSEVYEEELWMGRGLARAELGLWREAVDDFAESASWSRCNWRSRLELGQCLFELGDRERAIDVIDEVLEINRVAWEAWATRGHLNARMGQWSAAADNFARAVDADPGRLELYCCLLFAKLNFGDDRAIASLHATISKRFGQVSDRESADLIASTCVLLPGRVSEAATLVRLAEKSIAADPKDPAHLETLGAALFRAGRFDDAIARLSEAIRLGDGDGPPLARYFLALAHQSKGEAEAARRYLNEAIRASEPNESRRQTRASESGLKALLALLCVAQTRAGDSQFEPALSAREEPTREYRAHRFRGFEIHSRGLRSWHQPAAVRLLRREAETSIPKD